jgi:hypothetical protein
MELILEADYDAHSSEDEDITAQSDTDNDTDDVNDINFTRWTENTNYRPTAPVVHRFTRDPSGLQQTEPTHINNEPSLLSILNARQRRQGSINVPTSKTWHKTQQTLAYAK